MPELGVHKLAINTKDHFSFCTAAPIFMGLRVMAQQVGVVRAKGCGFALLVLLFLTSLSLRLHSQETEKPASLRGTVRDSQGKTVAGATVRLQRKDSQAQMVHTDSRGNYNFPAIGGGVYVLRAEMAGYGDTEIPSLFLAPQEAKNLDLVLLPAKYSTSSQSASTQAPKFFDEPQFSVAGVTDTTKSRRSRFRHDCARPGIARQGNGFARQSAFAARCWPRERKILARERGTRPTQL